MSNGFRVEGKVGVLAVLQRAVFSPGKTVKNQNRPCFHGAGMRRGEPRRRLPVLELPGVRRLFALTVCDDTKRHTSGRLWILLLAVLFIFRAAGFGAADAEFYRCGKEAVNSAMGKLDLKPARIWGGDESGDEEQYFRFPSDIAVGPDNLVYIVDSMQHRVRVFTREGRFVRSIGQKGQGPGDLYNPQVIAFTSDGRLVVAEMGNRRIQVMDLKGKHLYMFKSPAEWLSGLHCFPGNIAAAAGTSWNRDAPVVTLLDMQTGNIAGRFGRILVEAGADGRLKNGKRAPTESDQPESQLFAAGADGWCYIAAYGAPFFRRYDPQKNLRRVTAYETSIPSPRVFPNPSGGEPIIRGKAQSAVCVSMDVDRRNRVFLVVAKRERKKGEVFFITDKRVSTAPPVIRTDRFRLLVFAAAGGILAAADLAVHCDRIRIFDDTLFIIDTYNGNVVYEYSVVWK